jgi:cellulose 1,4-beta-cellobiosidase
MFEIVFMNPGDISMTIKKQPYLACRPTTGQAASPWLSTSSIKNLCLSVLLASLAACGGGTGGTSAVDTKQAGSAQQQAAGDPVPLVTTGNPFENALQYLDPDYVAKVGKSLALVPAQSGDATLMKVAQKFPTAVWLDRLAAIDGNKAQGGAMGLVEHLNAAVAQQAAKSAGGSLKPITVLLVVYDLPDRDCAALASNGELSSDANGLAIYKTQYVDRIAEIVARPAYAGLRIVTVIEPDSFPNMLTNIGTGKPKCDAVNQKKVYVEGIQYTLKKLSTIKNVYMYLDIAHSGWLGWNDNRAKAITGFKDLVLGATGNLGVIRGFASNTANYTPLDEPYFDGTDTVVSTSGTTQFYEWNRMVDEQTYIDKLRAEFVAAGFPASLSFIVDTSRNGWGGAKRPAAVAADVDDMRIDRRSHRGNWCNVKDAGIGQLPRANPDAQRPYVDAYVFIKPPGDSDGTSDSTATSPNADGKRFDAMCGSGNVDALQGAPHAGDWFHNQFVMLLRNAYPSLTGVTVTLPPTTTTLPPTTTTLPPTTTTLPPTTTTLPPTTTTLPPTTAGTVVVPGVLTKQSTWNTGYCANVKVTNTSAATITWKTTVPLEGKITSSWNANITVSGTQLTALGVDWNKSLAPQASAEFGFCATTSP